MCNCSGSQQGASRGRADPRKAVALKLSKPRSQASSCMVPGAPGVMVSGESEVTGLERMPLTSGKAA